MQQWIYYIKGLESVFDAREVEIVGRQIDGVDELVVDFSAESIILRAASRDVFKRLEEKVSQLGFRLLSKGYVLKSMIVIDDLANDDVRKTVQKKIGAHTFVQKIDIRPMSKTVILTHDSEFSVKDFVCKLNNVGINARISRQSLGQSIWQTLASVLAFLSILLFLSGLIINLTLHNANFALLAYVLSISCAFPLLIIKSGRQLFLERKINHTLLLVLVGGLCIYLGLWFETAFLGVCRVFLLRSEVQLGELLRESWSTFNSFDQQVTHLKTGDSRVAVESEQLMIGHVITIQAGEKIPVDGIVILGRGEISNLNLVGDKKEYALVENNRVYAGQLLISGKVDVRVTADAKSSVLNILRHRLITMQTKMRDEECKLSKMTKTLLMVVCAVATVVIVSVMLLDMELSYLWVDKAMALIFVAGIGLVVVAAQYSYLFSLLVSAKGGVYFFKPAYWKKMSGINTVILDKEGVITCNMPEVQEVISISDYSIKDVLCIAASLSHEGNDSRFSPVCTRAKQGNENSAVFKRVTKINAVKGKSIEGEIDGKAYFIGSQNALEARGLVTESVNQKLQLWQAEGANILLVADESQVFGLITIVDPVRDEISSFIDCAHDMLGLKVVMLSQDNAGTAQVLANRYDFDDVVSEVTDDDIETAIKKYTKDESVLLITNRVALATFDENKITVLSNILGSASDFSTIDSVVDSIAKSETSVVENTALNENAPPSFSKDNTIISLSERLIPVLKIIGMSREIQSRVKYMLYLIGLVKVMLLVGVMANVLSLGIVIGFEFLLGFWVLASTYRPAFKYYNDEVETSDAMHKGLGFGGVFKKKAVKDTNQSKGYVGRHLSSRSVLKHY